MRALRRAAAALPGFSRRSRSGRRTRVREPAPCGSRRPPRGGTVSFPALPGLRSPSARTPARVFLRLMNIAPTLGKGLAAAGRAAALATGLVLVTSVAWASEVKTYRCGVDKRDYPAGPEIWPESIRFNDTGTAEFRIVLNRKPESGFTMKLKPDILPGPDAVWAQRCMNIAPQQLAWDENNWNKTQKIQVGIGAQSGWPQSGMMATSSQCLTTGRMRTTPGNGPEQNVGTIDKSSKRRNWTIRPEISTGFQDIYYSLPQVCPIDVSVVKTTIDPPKPLLSISDAAGEEGDELTFAVKLDGKAGKKINIPVEIDNLGETEGLSVSTPTLSFEGIHAEEYKVVRVNTTENSFTDGERSFKVTLDTADATDGDGTKVGTSFFNTASDTEGAGRIFDDDPAVADRCLTVSDTSLVVYENATWEDYPKQWSAGYTATTTTRPPDRPGSVTITPTVSDSTVIRVGPSSWTVDPSNWRLGGIVQVYAVDDGIANTADRTATITHTVSDNYGAPESCTPPTITVTVKQVDVTRVRPADVAFHIYYPTSPTTAENRRYNEALKAIGDANIRYVTRSVQYAHNVGRTLTGLPENADTFNMPRFFLRDPTAAGWSGRPHESNASGANNSSSVQWVKDWIAGRDTGSGAGTTATLSAGGTGAAGAASGSTIIDGSAVTEGEAIEFRVRLEDPAPQGGTTVKVRVSDAAQSDFIAAEHEGEHQVSVPVGRRTATLRIRTVNDGADEEDGTISAVLVEGEGYRIGSPSSAQALVSDDDEPPPPGLPQATVIDADRVLNPAQEESSVSEGGTLTMMVRLNKAAPDGGLDVGLTVAESAGHDYLSPDNEGSQTVSFPAGSSVAAYYLRTEGDDVYRSDGTVTIAIAEGAGYTAGSPSSALVTVQDDEDPASAPVVPGTSIAAGASPITAGGEASFTVTLTTPAPAPGVAVALTVSEAEGADVVAPDDEGSNTLSFAAGETSKTYTVATQAGGDDGPSGTVTVAIAEGAGYTVGSPSQASVTVNDAEPPAFESSSYSFDLEENANGATTAVALGTVSATAAATGDTVSYHIAAGDTDGKFAIGGSDGALTYTAEGENHEDFSDPSAAFTLTVRASDGTAHGDVTVTVGVTDVAEPPGTPEAPSVSATADSTTGLDASWGAPSNTGPDITGYDVRYRASSSEDFIDGPQDVTGTSTALTDLAPGTTYEVQVRATNDEGDSDWSDSGSGTTSAAPAAPAQFAVYHDASDPQATGRYDEGIRALDAADLSYVVRSATRAQVSSLAGVSNSVMPRFFFGDPTTPGWTSQPKVNNGGLQWLKSKVAELIDEDSEATDSDAASAQALFRVRVYHDAGDAAAVERFDTAMAELAAAGIEPEVIEGVADGTPARLAGHTRVRLPRFFVGEPEANGRYPDERNGGLRWLRAWLAKLAGLSVADARVTEGGGATLDFTVTLGTAATQVVAVDYTTADGTATAGADYTATSGTLAFAAGETAKTVSVPVLDDAHDEGEETLTLTLSNAAGARIADAEATGTIANTDPLQREWLARFGRTVAGQMIEALEGRFAMDPGTRSHLTIAGWRLDFAGAAPLPEHDRWRDEEWSDQETRDMDLREVLLGSSFHFTTGAVSGLGAMTAWGKALTGGASSAPGGGLSLASETVTGVLGMDWERDKVLVGVALSESVETGSAGFAPSGGEYDLEGALSLVTPYARIRASDRLSVWTMMGSGEGSLSLAHGDASQSADIALQVVAAGGRAELLRPEGEGFSLALKTDAYFVRTESAGLSAPGVGNLASARGDASRVRAVLEGSRSFALSGGGSVEPSLSLGLRHDGGDAETGTGVELGAGLAWSDPSRGLTSDLRFYGLAAHEADGHDEWGVSGSLRIAPAPSGRGLSLSMMPSWGAQGESGRLWDTRPSALAGDGGEPPVARLDTELGYGLSLSGGLTGTPYVGLGFGEARDYRLGWRLASRRWQSFSLGVEAARSEGANDDGPEHRIGLDASFRW